LFTDTAGPIKAIIEDVKKQRPLFVEIVKGLRQAALEVLEVNRDLAVAAAITNKNGWWLVNSMPIVFYRDLVKVEDQITPEALSQIIVDYVNHHDCAELVEVVDRWHVPSFEQRNVIFKDALWAHKEGRYILTIPTLVIQIEGILRE